MMKTNFNNELQQLQMELRAQNFDIIRFSTYRTACKLRFIQKKLNFHHLDLLNVIESLRESLEILTFERRNSTSLSINHLSQFLTLIYTNLNKRLPHSQQIVNINHCVYSAIAWFFYVYKTSINSISFTSFRVVLILLCTGKLIDKLRHLFTSCFPMGSTQTLTYGQIDQLLHEILAIPYALQEISRSTKEKNYARLIFSHLSSPITWNDFLNNLVYNNSKLNCLQWLIIFHRLISVENVIHRVKCSACQRPSFSGFRYKCLQCHQTNYQLCQDCFWRGRTSQQHLSTHEMKEYTYFRSSNKTLRNSFRRSCQCMPKVNKRDQLLTPLTIDQEQQLPVQMNKVITDEHRQIASYTNQLAHVTDQQQSHRESSNEKRAEKKVLIAKLEAENKRIQHEINTLRTQLKHQSLEQLTSNDDQLINHYNQNDDYNIGEEVSFYPIRRTGSMGITYRNPYFEDELQALIDRKQQLDIRIRRLQQSREELTTQLDYLEKNFNPYRRSKISNNTSFRSYSSPATPIHHRLPGHLRSDLLLAADSLTSAMSSLVHQLNTDVSDNNFSVIKSNIRSKSYFHEGSHWTDEESFFTSDDDNDQRALNIFPYNQNNRKENFLI